MPDLEPELKIVLDDRQLDDLNRGFHWIIGQRDDDGRRIGSPDRPSELIDSRISRVAETVELSGQRVLEPGCLDGHITLGLCAKGADVTSFDLRPICVAKTFSRCLAFGFRPKLLVHDARRMSELGEFDLVFHCGLFYHLTDPISHLRSIARMAPVISLDTHTARPDAEPATFHGYRGAWVPEGGWSDEQSGVSQESFWLEEPELCRLFNDCQLTWDCLHRNDNAIHGPRSHWLLRPRGQGTTNDE
jgi:hypothetical protein